MTARYNTGDFHMDMDVCYFSDSLLTYIILFLTEAAHSLNLIVASSLVQLMLTSYQRFEDTAITVINCLPWLAGLLS